MRILGIITEYNPFHNGHAYQLHKAKELTGADYCIIVMSGNFTQRGYPALISKHERAKMALSQGADLVLELPAIYATSSAEQFACGGISLLENLGCVTDLAFGAETNSPEQLQTLANLLLEQDHLLQTSIRQYLSQGDNYPVARKKAIKQLCSYSQTFSLSDESLESLDSPNNILGIEYLKAIKRLHSSMNPCIIRREGVGYHDTTLSTISFASASGIREYLEQNSNLAGIKHSVPSSVYQIIENVLQVNAPITADDFSDILFQQLLYQTADELSSYSDCTLSLAEKIKANLPDFRNISQFAATLKSKDLTHSRITRVLCHILLKMRSDDFMKMPDSNLLYARILGFNAESTPLLHHLKCNSQLPLISKLADAPRILNACQQNLLSQDLQSSALYYYIQSRKNHTQPINEHRISPVRWTSKR